MSTSLIILLSLIVIAIVVFIVVSKQGRKSVSKSRLAQSSAIESNHKQIYVGNLAYSVLEVDLRNFFKSFGEITEVRVVKNTKTGRSKGFAFITYKNLNGANSALSAHGEQFQGRRMVVRIAKARD